MLEDQYYGSTDAMKDPVLTKRAWYITNYVEKLGLNLDSYHDSGWDKVMLSDFEFSGKEEWYSLNHRMILQIEDWFLRRRGIKYKYELLEVYCILV